MQSRVANLVAKGRANLVAKRGAIAQLLFWGVIFGIGYTQDPIYNSPENQNTKYFHALARAGYGFLREDWLASTLDPLPAFTALVQFTYTFLHHEYAFYGYYILIFCLYIHSLRGIVESVFPIAHHRIRTLLFFAFFFFVHIVHIEIFLFDIGWELHAGVAEQYILGPVFQPANFGVFILWSIYLFLKHRPFWSVVMLAIAVTLHPAYFPSIATLIGVYVVLMAWNECRGLDRTILRPIGLGALGILLALPVYLYMTLAFQDTSPELAQQATDIIVNRRIPHHSLPKYWLLGPAYAQTVIMAIALWLVRKHRLGLILGLPFVLGVGLTALQIQLDSDTLAFIAPWRMSVFIMPIATSLLLARGAIALANAFPSQRSQRRIQRICVVAIAALVFAGGVLQVRKFYATDHTTAMLMAVREMKQSGDVYVVPPDDKELRKFRLFTGAVIFTNRKSHPYKDTEVIEWNQRWTLAKRFYRAESVKQRCRVLNRQLAKTYQVSHVVLPVDQGTLNCDGWADKYEDADYRIYARL